MYIDVAPWVLLLTTFRSLIFIFRIHIVSKKMRNTLLFSHFQTVCLHWILIGFLKCYVPPLVSKENVYTTEITSIDLELLNQPMTNLLSDRCSD